MLYVYCLVSILFWKVIISSMTIVSAYSEDSRKVRTSWMGTEHCQGDSHWFSGGSKRENWRNVSEYLGVWFRKKRAHGNIISDHWLCAQESWVVQDMLHAVIISMFLYRSFENYQMWALNANIKQSSHGKMIQFLSS